MKMKVVLLCSVLCVSFLPMTSSAQTNYEEQAALATALFRALRATVANNQDAIHDTANYFKDPDSKMEILLGQAKSFYQALSQRNLDEDLKSPNATTLQNMIKAYRMTVKEIGEQKISLTWTANHKNQYSKKWDGKLLPARFARLLATKLNELDPKVKIKLTTSRQLLVNEDNAPDEWESQVIEEQMVMKNKTEEKAVSKDFGGTFRYMLPEFYLPACIGCHGTATGQEGPQIHPNPNLQRGVGSYAGTISLVMKK